MIDLNKHKDLSAVVHSIRTLAYRGDSQRVRRHLGNIPSGQTAKGMLEAWLAGRPSWAIWLAWEGSRPSDKIIAVGLMRSAIQSILPEGQPGSWAGSRVTCRNGQVLQLLAKPTVLLRWAADEQIAADSIRIPAEDECLGAVTAIERMNNMLQTDGIAGDSRESFAADSSKITVTQV